MQRVIKSLILAITAAVVLAPAQARADGFFTPWVGSAFGSNIQNGQTTVGISAGGMGAGIIGGEVDLGWSPSFFGTKSDFGNNTVMNVMGSVIVGIPIGGQHGAGIRPYAVGGLGLIRSADRRRHRRQRVLIEQHVRLGCRRRRDGLLQRSRRAAGRPALSAGDERSENRHHHAWIWRATSSISGAPASA